MPEKPERPRSLAHRPANVRFGKHPPARFVDASRLRAGRHNLAIPNLTVCSSSKRLNTRRNFRSLLDGSSYQAAQHFRHTPGLRDAAPWGERRFSVEDLANRADAGFGEMRFKAIEKSPCCRAIIGIDPEPGIDERADQPSPHSALVIGCIASAQIAEVARLVLGLAWRQRAKPDRSDQLSVHRGNNPLPIFPVEDPVIERNREDLVRSEGVVVPILAINDIVQIAARGVPKTTVERIARLVRISCELVSFSASGSCTSRSQSASRRSALYQSALITTALPRRGVTTQSPTFASIQARAKPSAPWVRSPSFGSTLMPKACRRDDAARCPLKSAEGAPRTASLGNARRSGGARERTTTSHRRCGRGTRFCPSGNMFGISPSLT